MKKFWPVALAVSLAGFLVFSPGFGTVWAADSGGYGEEESSSGYGEEESSSGYGEEESSSGYGEEESSSGYGEEEASSGYGEEESSSGYGEEESSSGYGEEESSSGYGEEEASSGYGEEESSSGYGEEEASSGYGEEESSSGYGEEAASSGYGEEESSGYGEEKKAAPPVVGKAAKKAPVKKAAVKKKRIKKKKTTPPINIGFVLSSLFCGLALGWVLQRGRFCMNTAFRDTIFIKEFTTLRGYFIVLIVAIVGTHLLGEAGLITIQRQSFMPFAQFIGGFIFGLGMVLAGGCGSGIWYRVGEGQLASWVAVMGFFIGITMTVDGVLRPLYDLLRGFSVKVGGKGGAALWNIVGDGPVIQWAVIALVAVGLFIAILPDKPFKLGGQKGYYWSVTGLLIGIIAVLCFYASDKWGGFPRGISFTTPTRELFYTLMRADAQAPSYFPAYALGNIKLTWGVLFLVGVPLGAYFSARGFKEFSWKVPPAKELLVVLLGSLMMGFGGSTAGGCNMGQGVTGVATLSIGSIVATIGIVLGCWTMVYFKFIKPMQDMDLD